MRIGAQISSAGGADKVFERAELIEAEAIQMFISAPQQWRAPALSDEVVARFISERERAGLPVFFHGIYLVNLGTADEALLQRSVSSLTQWMDWAARLGAIGTIFHAGSHLGVGFDAVLPQICRSIEAILSATPETALLILENNAGQGAGIGTSFGELGAIIRGCGDNPRLAVCIDTCHAFAMGYDIATTDGCDKAMQEFDQEIGFPRLVAVHANDSKMELGGMHDRHENIGDGHIGSDGFRTILGHSAYADVPFLLEVPGIEGKGPDAENIRRLKALRAEVAAT